MGMKILVIPDAQVRDGVNIDHLTAAGNYMVKHRPDTVVVLGDWWDMPSLSFYTTKMEVEGKRILADLRAGEIALTKFLKPLRALQHKQAQDKKKVYRPRLVYTVGNHDPQVRIPRFLEDNPTMEGMISGDWTTNFLQSNGFEVYQYMEIVNIEGIRFSHYFINPHSARKNAQAGMIDTAIKNIGFSFVQGHQQGMKLGKHYLGDGSTRIGVVAGSFYSHDEDYMGIQGNNSHWRGIIQLNEVKNGGADICELSLDYLVRRYYDNNTNDVVDALHS